MSLLNASPGCKLKLAWGCACQVGTYVGAQARMRADKHAGRSPGGQTGRRAGVCGLPGGRGGCHIDMWEGQASGVVGEQPVGNVGQPKLPSILLAWLLGCWAAWLRGWLVEDGQGAACLPIC